MSEERNPYKGTHPRQELSLELNFRSFMAGEGAPFFQPVPLEEISSFAAVGCPITIPTAGTYSAEELLQVAAAVRKGGSTMTLLGAAEYPSELLERLDKEAPGQIRRG
jgi:hypothetical protein